MKLIFSFMMCSALAASVLMEKAELDKCSIEYIKYLVQESCIRHLRERRHDSYYNIRLDSAPPHRFDKRHVRELPRVPHHLLPKNVTMSLVAKRRIKKHVKRDTDEDHDVYFIFCCEHMERCENLDCL